MELTAGLTGTLADGVVVVGNGLGVEVVETNSPAGPTAGAIASTLSTLSPPAMVHSAKKVAAGMLAGMNRTLPSAMIA